MVNSQKPPSIFVKHTILDVWQDSCNFTKKETLAQVFSGEISKNTFFNRTPLEDCFWNMHVDTK